MNMKGITEELMKDIGIYVEQSEDENLVMLVFNKKRIEQIGSLDKNLLPTGFVLNVGPQNGYGVPAPGPGDNITAHNNRIIP